MICTTKSDRVPCGRSCKVALIVYSESKNYNSLLSQKYCALYSGHHFLCVNILRKHVLADLAQKSIQLEKIKPLLSFMVSMSSLLPGKFCDTRNAPQES